jgi:transcriptional regulator with XRE-family HTH domain
MADICKNIRHLRELKNFSQSYMANRLGVSQKTYSRIETDQRITLKQLQYIAEILEVTVERIMKFDHNENFRDANPRAETINTGSQNADPVIELYVKIIAAKEDIIKSLRNEIDFLKGTP